MRDTAPIGIEFRSRTTSRTVDQRHTFSQNLGKSSRSQRKKNRGYDIALDQYRELSARLPITRDVREKNLIYRRLVNLLDVMQFLNSNPGRQL